MHPQIAKKIERDFCDKIAAIEAAMAKLPALRRGEGWTPALSAKLNADADRRGVPVNVVAAEVVEGYERHYAIELDVYRAQLSALGNRQ